MWLERPVQTYRSKQRALVLTSKSEHRILVWTYKSKQSVSKKIKKNKTKRKRKEGEVVAATIATWVARVGWRDRGREGVGVDVGVERMVRRIILNMGISRSFENF